LFFSSKKFCQTLLAVNLSVAAGLALEMPFGGAAVAQAPSEDTPTSTLPKQPAQLSPIDLELNKYQADIDKRALSQENFEKLNQLVEQNPTNPRAHLVFGYAYDALGLVDEAVAQYKLADKFGPKDPEAIAAIIHNLSGKGGGEAANELLNDAIKRFPNDAKILYLIGKRLHEKHHDAQALKILIKAYQAGSKVPGLDSELAELLIARDPYKAIYLSGQDLKDNTDFAPALVSLSKAFMSVGSYNSAVIPLARLFALEPEHEETTKMYITSLFWQGDFKRALMPALYYLKLNSDFAVSEIPPSLMVANVISRVPNDFADAQLAEFYKRVAGASGKIPPGFHFFVGRIFFRQHRWAQAKAELNQFYNTDNKNGEVLWMLGRIAERGDHDYKAALNYYQLAHAALPYNGRVEASLNALQDRVEDGGNDWAFWFREWLTSTFHF
jgi:tetratricopeptide (TPR) repeat protein